ncbi:uncharacterized protein [Drosophila takahashii]|uniref:uncharacterized protein n=1 Tax=Drosophila takahashii TaxID=29030 RepID=UPI0007E5E9DC|nr:uncharacterized protein LOC108055552 [Drosophila takahashii]
MHLRKFLCCMPLKYGVIIAGASFGLLDFIIGCYGWNMLIKNEFPKFVVEFFRTMDTRICVAGFATVLWLLMINNFLLVYAVLYKKLLLIGTWLLINYMVFLFTLVTVLLDSWAFIRIGCLGYCLIVVKSYYTELSVVEAVESDSSRGASESEDESNA